MVYKEDTVYKQGLTLDDISNNSIWEDITDKLGTKETAGFSFTRINITYNKLIGLIRVRGYSSSTTPMSGVTKVFTFNNDLPGYDTSNAIFYVEACCFSFIGEAALLRAIPYGPVSNINGFVTVQLISGSTSFEYDSIVPVNNSLKDQLDQYLENH